MEKSYERFLGFADLYDEGRPSLPEKAMEILQTDKKTQERFFDIAAKGRKELPADIAEVVYDNPVILGNIRKNLKELSASN